MRRVFIVRKDLHLTSGKLAAMVAHCAEAYWINMIKNFKGMERKKIKEFGGGSYYNVNFQVDGSIMNDYICDIFTKTICEAKNLNHLMKAKSIAEELGLVEDVDYFIISDCCKTELQPEYVDENGIERIIVGISFKPLPDETAHKISKKYQLYRG